MRSKHVEKCRQSPGNCGKCGTTISKGESYVWTKGRYTGKKIRCSKSECRFRPSDLTGSDKLSRVYAAQEAAEDAIGSWDGDDVSDLKSELSSAADEIREVAGEYRESADNIRQSFSESSTADECEEKADGLESWADEIEEANLEEFDEDDVEIPADADEDAKTKAIEEAKEEWRENVRDEARSPLENCPL